MYKLKPVFKTAIWGGERMQEYFNIPTLGIHSEAWVLSCHPDGSSIIENGEYAGKKLVDVISSCDIGRNYNPANFPILIKYIDAKDKLSIQVHPDDEYAKAYTDEKNGKTECWYIIDCEPGAELILGVNQELSKDEFRTAINDGTLPVYCNHVPVKKGDVAFIPAKTLHAIGAGIFLLEVQQSSNTTYRAYDYQRRDKTTGQLRDLHIDDAVEVTDLTVQETNLSPIEKRKFFDDTTRTRLAECDFFSMSLMEVDGRFEGFADFDSFVSIVIIDGNFKATDDGCEYLDLKQGDSVFIPADSGTYTLKGKGSFIITTI
jgi:mannose-6-phosphate isomerase